ncbi:MAG: alanine--tRNA ligase, partial [Candidatus Omnitrophota bacterium]
EIFYDWGRDVGCGKEECSPACECGRFVEVWNLVFTQFERKSDGSLDPLPSKNIDTGMGLERMVSVMQNVHTNFQTDLFTPIIKRVREELGKDISESDANLIVDHTRAAAFAIADGVSPSNEKRGYVVRKLIRRAYLKGSAKKEPFLFNLVPIVARIFEDVYPELQEKREHVSAIIEEEERRFNDTLESAMPVLSEMLSGKPKTLEGEKIFKLVDTYGLPLDIIEEEAKTAGTELDISKFEELMEERKEESRRGSDLASEFIFQPDKFRKAPNPGYSDELPLDAKLEFILKDGQVAEKLERGERAEVITSPQSGKFYAEAGGQVGDTGRIVKEGGEMRVLNTFEVDGRKVLEVFVKSGPFSMDDKVELRLDADKKQMTALNHTATHMLQAALRKVLGEHVKQSGSLVDEKRLRFDFTHMKKLADREIEKVEDIINGWIEEKIPVCKEVKTLKEAREEGALSFFGEKYGEEVRTVSVGAYSKELCGGTHVDNTSEIELVKIVSESSVASGIRRIEALTGENARDWIKKTLEELLNRKKFLCRNFDDPSQVEKQCPGLPEAVREAGDIVGGKVEIDKEVVDDFDNRLKPLLLKGCEEAEKAIKKGKKAKVAGVFSEVKEKLDKIIAGGEIAGGVSFISDVFENVDMPVLRKAAGYAEKKVKSGIVFLGGDKEGKAYIICAVTPDLAEKGISAQDLVGKVAGKIKGGGGGKDTFAQAGGENPGGLKAALEEAKKIIEEKLK